MCVCVCEYMRVCAYKSKNTFHNNSTIIMAHKPLQQAEEIDFTQTKQKATRSGAREHKLVQTDCRHKPVKAGADPVQTICSVCPNHPIHPLLCVFDLWCCTQHFVKDLVLHCGGFLLSLTLLQILNANNTSSHFGPLPCFLCLDFSLSVCIFVSLSPTHSD